MSKFNFITFVLIFFFQWTGEEQTPEDMQYESVLDMLNVARPEAF